MRHCIQEQLPKHHFQASPTMCACIRTLFLLILFVAGSASGIRPAFRSGHGSKNCCAKILFVRNKVVLDKVTLGDTLKHRFRFKNTGNENLVIHAVEPSCTCTNFILSKKTVAPGESAYVELRVVPKIKYGQELVYAIVKTNTQAKYHKISLAYAMAE